VESVVEAEWAEGQDECMESVVRQSGQKDRVSGERSRGRVGRRTG